MPGEARVALILAKYAVLGVVPIVIPTILFDVPIPTDRIPTQKGTDLEYLEPLAEPVGLRLLRRPRPGARR